MTDPTNEMSKMVGRLVAHWRMARHLSQPDLALLLSGHGITLHPSAISKVEKGHRGLSVVELLGLAVALNVPPIALLSDGSNNPTPVTQTVTRPGTTVRRWLLGEQPLLLDDDEPLLQAKRDEFIASVPPEVRRFWHDSRDWSVVRHMSIALEDLRALAHAMEAREQTGKGLEPETARILIENVRTSTSRALQEAMDLAYTAERSLPPAERGSPKEPDGEH